MVKVVLEGCGDDAATILMELDFENGKTNYENFERSLPAEKLL